MKSFTTFYLSFYKVMTYNTFRVSVILLSQFFALIQAVDGQNEIKVDDFPGIGNFALVESGRAAKLIIDSNDAEVVSIAATAFSNDVELISGVKPEVSTNFVSGVSSVIIGTLGKSLLIDNLASQGKIQAEKVRGKWETFGISVVQNPFEGVANALVIFGSDPRGTAFGVFELSRILGVSPWVWWADVLPEPKNELYIASGSSIFGPPSVKYRGIFLNDEDWGLQPWAALNHDTDIKDIGPKTYEKIFELMLRMKANYIWPAMHECTKAFWYYNGNPEMARRYSIVLGSSHAEPMLRNNVDEWINNLSYSYNSWNWATNSSVIKNYWSVRAGESRNNDAVYTLGIRGVHDSGLPGYSDNQSKVIAMKDIIAAQRKILADSINKPINTIPQMFCPYKEALTLYNLGLNLADDITLVWVDDNHGYMRQLSTPTEQQRSGGAGVYYHLSYWGAPEDYLWLSSISPSLISYEMYKAYELNARNLWVFNVGDIKPAELETQFAMDLAWDVTSWTPEKAHLYSKVWAKETFGEAFAEDIWKIKTEYYRLAAAGKPEHLTLIPYTQQEMDKRVADYERLVEYSQLVESKIPDRLKDAYFQLISYPVEGAATMNKKVFFAKKSLKLASEGKNEALNYTGEAVNAFNTIVSQTGKYNNTIAGGKWKGMMSYNPRSRSYFNAPTVATAANIGTQSLPAIQEEVITIIPAQSFIAKSDAGFKIDTISGLGQNGCAVAVLPLNYTSYTASTINNAPFVEYNVPVVKGLNSIRVKSLPSFPLYGGMQLRFGISIAGGTTSLISIATTTESSVWTKNVINGYAVNEMKYTSESDKIIKVRIYFADPGYVLSSLELVQPVPESTFTTMLNNPDFEYASLNRLNTSFPLRGTPYGWNQSGAVQGNSFGIHNDASNFNGNGMCWYNVNSSPYAMPANFELYQTLENLPAGKYVVRCRLAVMAGQMTTVRLFANNNVQYYGSSSGYISNLTPGENNTFASHKGVSSMTKANLSEMAVAVEITEGNSLRLGIRSGNRRSDGTSVSGSDASNVPGGFKVDYFRIEKIDASITSVKAFTNSDVTIFCQNGKICIASTKIIESGKVELFTILGVKIHESIFNRRDYAIEQVMPGGIYVIKLKINNSEIVKTIVV